MVDSDTSPLAVISPPTVTFPDEVETETAAGAVNAGSETAPEAVRTTLPELLAVMEE